MGEAKAALQLLAIKKATNLRIKNIITEGDSLVVIYTIQHKYLSMGWQIGPLNTKKISSSFQLYVKPKTKRHPQNTLTDKANYFLIFTEFEK
jgi:hypothetical protein